MTGWRVFWIPSATRDGGLRRPLLAGWTDLKTREDSVGIRSGDPIFLSPGHRIDPLLTLYAQSRVFRGYTVETRRNHVTDLRLFLTFLSMRNASWIEASRNDIEDYEDWRRFAEQNPRRIGGAKWDRELSALASLYTWAVDNQHIERSPVDGRVRGREKAAKFGVSAGPRKSDGAHRHQGQ